MQLVDNVLFFVWLAVLAMVGYAIVHAALQRADAFPAADKSTKTTWLAILGGALACDLLLVRIGIVICTVIAAVAAGVYLVDVRPKVLDVQGKSH